MDFVRSFKVIYIVKLFMALLFFTLNYYITLSGADIGVACQSMC